MLPQNESNFWVLEMFSQNLHMKIQVGEEHFSVCWFRKTSRIDWWCPNILNIWASTTVSLWWKNIHILNRGMIFCVCVCLYVLPCRKCLRSQIDLKSTKLAKVFCRSLQVFRLVFQFSWTSGFLERLDVLKVLHHKESELLKT